MNKVFMRCSTLAESYITRTRAACLESWSGALVISLRRALIYHDSKVYKAKFALRDNVAVSAEMYQQYLENIKCRCV